MKIFTTQKQGQQRMDSIPSQGFEQPAPTGRDLRPGAPRRSGRRRRTLRSLSRTAGHGIVRGAATAFGTFAMGSVIWWVQQR
ncbi:hypothetical protein [Streptomyces sp. NBC_01294]|uniref:hypothetical protein n=1 Tax=Streptomyces sp. NBC_01294 TaxID=2903815 RepID=UPI002DDBB90E|nr:hypothetical protein [Streptomyces sp. NBC_01294]WRZ62183.1 hypothetical protein OG534_37510 [Streptomyces sp. NBC_01294]